MLGGGAWTSKNQKSMREKYYLSREQYSKMEAPTLKGTELNMAIKCIDFCNLSKNILSLHQQARDVDKLGLREHETHH